MKAIRFFFATKNQPITYFSNKVQFSQMLEKVRWFIAEIEKSLCEKAEKRRDLLISYAARYLPLNIQ
jgi:hypothetical protein